MGCGAVPLLYNPCLQKKWFEVCSCFPFKGTDYFLTGTLQGLSTRTAAGTSDYILYDFHLVDARTSAIVWEDHAEIKKQGLEDAAYR